MSWLSSLLAYFQPVWRRYPNPPVTPASSESAALNAAIAYVGMTAGAEVSTIAFTGSMLPTLQGGDCVGLVPTPFNQLKVGDIVTYKAEWFAGVGLVIHRLVAKDSGGFIASGDNNAHSEPQWRITPASYHLRCAQVFRFPQAQPQKFSV